jgi:hypothetical protein
LVAGLLLRAMMAANALDNIYPFTRLRERGPDGR